MPDQAVSEARLWAWLKAGADALGPAAHASRVENGVASGTPDVEACIQGQPFWIELKCAKRPSTTDGLIRVKFRPSQAPWLRRRTAAGGDGFVLIQVGSGADALRYLVHGRSAAELALEDVREDRMARLAVVDPRATARRLWEGAAQFVLARRTGYGALFSLENE